MGIKKPDAGHRANNEILWELRNNLILTIGLGVSASMTVLNNRDGLDNALCRNFDVGRGDFAFDFSEG